RDLVETEGKALWLAEGDCNTTFSHSQEKGPCRCNTIKRLKDKHGWIFTRDSEIQSLVLDYFLHISRSTHPNIRRIDECFRCLTPIVSSDMNVGLVCSYSLEEVEHALKQMHLLKSPGSDQKFWHVIGDDT
ncbi:UNVERIFIED_CONTAM: hypothetical protein Sindi_2557500, partial [Sesamum indicum]